MFLKLTAKNKPKLNDCGCPRTPRGFGPTGKFVIRKVRSGGGMQFLSDKKLEKCSQLGGLMVYRKHS